MPNTGTGFWVVVALIAALTIATIIELVLRMILSAPRPRVAK
ncbi:hypothetical protein [Bradyrhizobium sp. LHD-71]|nr:hypothetical protein [Bradyrhizobium sp. LHD-71]MDQ8726125.1 hypothetical protein [Bradyrhizobium sp. LHD-71]